MQKVSGMGTVAILRTDFVTTEVLQTNMIRGLAEMYHTKTRCDVHFEV